MHIERKNIGTSMELKVGDSSHRLSWTIGVSGCAQFMASTYERGDWVTLSIAEYGPKSIRETIMTLDKEAGIALRDLLNEAFPKD